MFKKILIGLSIAFVFAGCNGKPEQETAVTPAAVIVDKASFMDINISDSFSGKLQAAEQAAIILRVSGTLEKIHVREGDYVKKDQLILSIDSEPYEMTVRQAEAALAQAKANQQNTSQQRARAEALLATDGISKANYDNVVAADSVAKANVAAAQAALDGARLNLKYTQVTAPIAGRVGLIVPNIGETVSPSSGTITTVVAPDPIYAIFSVSDRQLQQLRDRYGDLTKDISLSLSLSNGTTYAGEGKINFIDTTVTTNTDSVLIRGEFKNADGILTSGQTVIINTRSSEKTPMIVIPQVAIINDIGGKYVFVPVIEKGEDGAPSVTDDGKQIYRATRRDVITGDVLPGGLQAITGGLNEGDLIIIDGIQRISANPLLTIMMKADYDAMIAEDMKAKGDN